MQLDYRVINSTDCPFLTNVTNIKIERRCLAAKESVYKAACRSSKHIVPVPTVYEAQNEEFDCFMYGCLAVYRYGSR